MLRNALMLMLVASFTVACAKRPDAIAPASMGDAYSNISCQQARELLAAERVTLAGLEQEQRIAANTDAATVFLVLVPMSALNNSDKEGEIATSKGRVVALENRLIRCG